MALEVIFVSILFTFSIALVTLILFIMSKRKQAHGLLIMGLLFFVNLIYVLGYALELVAVSQTVKDIFNHIQYFGIPMILPFWLLLAVQFKDRNKKRGIIKILPVFIIPVISIILNLTHETNGLYYASSAIDNWRGIDVIIYQKGIWYHAQTIYNVILAMATVIIYTNIFRRAHGMKKKQSLILFIMSVLALLLSATSLISSKTSLIDFVPIVMSTVAILMFVTLFKYEMYDLVPVAYSQLFNALDYPVMILSDTMNIVKANSVALRVFSDAFEGIDNPPVKRLFVEDAVCIEKMKKGKECLIERKSGNTHRHYTVKMSVLFSTSRQESRDYGYLLIFNDVTEHTHQVQNLKNAAAVDPLTGLYNRRYFYTMAEYSISMVRKNKKSLSVIMLDIDHFKRINDLYGHQGGDYILKEVVGVIKKQLRENDIFARYGGEEFIVLLPSTDPGEAAPIARRICRAVRDSVLKYDGNNILLTISAGVSSIRPPAERGMDSLIFMADKALYDAKTTGRDRVCVRLD